MVETIYCTIARHCDSLVHHNYITPCESCASHRIHDTCILNSLMSSACKRFLSVLCSLLVPSPRRLRFKVINSNKLHIFWKEPKGAFDKYTFRYNYIPGKREWVNLQAIPFCCVILLHRLYYFDHLCFVSFCSKKIPPGTWRVQYKRWPLRLVTKCLLQVSFCPRGFNQMEICIPLWYTAE